MSFLYDEKGIITRGRLYMVDNNRKVLSRSVCPQQTTLTTLTFYHAKWLEWFIFLYTVPLHVI